jgi:Flp pilus assembly protein TadD
LYPEARIHIGTILKKDGKIDESISLIEKDITLKKDAYGLYSFLATLYQDKKDLKSAEGILKKGLEQSPQNIDLLYQLGVFYETTGRFEESIRYMEMVLKLEPDNSEALNFIGYSYADRGIKLDFAEQAIKKALELKPGNGYIIDSLGWVYFKKGNLALAEKYLKEATALSPGDPTIAEHLGEVYEKKGSLSEALEAYSRALKINPENESLIKKAERVKKTSK